MSASRARLGGKFSRLEAHLFINVVITRVILFCPAVPPSPPSAPSLVPRNATSFVSLLAKLLVLRARLFLPVYARARAYERENENESERERERVFSHERARSSRPLAFRFFHPFSFFLLLSLFPLSRGSLLVPFVPRAAVSFSFFLNLLPLRSPQCYRSRVSPRSRSFSFSSPGFFFLGGSRTPRCPFSFLPSSHSAAGGSFSIRVHTRESISPPQPLPRVLPYSPFSPFLVLFCPCRSRCSALFEFKRGSHRCLVSTS